MEIMFIAALTIGPCAMLTVYLLAKRNERRRTPKGGGWIDGKWTPGGGWISCGTFERRIGLNGEEEYRKSNLP